MTVVISPSLVENGGATPLTHARIGWQNLIRDGGVTQTGGEVEGFPADAVLRATTWERWKPASLPATLTIDAGSAVSGSYLGIAAHTLGSNGCTVTYEYSNDGSEWIQIEAFEPANDRAIMVLFTEIQAQYWRLTIDGTTAPTVGVVYIGDVLVMQRRIYGGHSPIDLSRTTEIRPNRSEKGQWLGRSIIRQGRATSFSWEHLTPAWYRDNFDPFVASAREYPFFISWYPDKYPEAVAYCWTNRDIQPSNMGTGKGLMEVSMQVEGFAE